VEASWIFTNFKLLLLSQYEGVLHSIEPLYPLGSSSTTLPRMQSIQQPYIISMWMKIQLSTTFLLFHEIAPRLNLNTYFEVNSMPSNEHA